jgi:hypothetical protein
MFPGSPSPLHSTTALRQAAALARPGLTGVWLSGCGRMRAVRMPGGRVLLVSRDLGRLLRRCDRVIVRDGEDPVVLPATSLIRCRVLEVVLGTPFLPAGAQLRSLFPSCVAGAGTHSIPLGLGSAEEALALFAAERVPVLASSIGYGGSSG